MNRLPFRAIVDSQLFLLYLEDKALPFSIETKYIWEKQIEEAEVLIINKTDLLSSEELAKLKRLTENLYPTKLLLFQNSLDSNSLTNWIDIISNTDQNQPHKTIEIDYVKYGKGEANLAWLDEEIEIITPDDSSVELAYTFINRVTEAITGKGLTIGHLKYFLVFNDKSLKISHTTISDQAVSESPVYEKAPSVDLLVNARIQTSPDELRKILFDNLNQLKSIPGVQVNEKFLSYFQPGFPNPTHRME